MKRLDTSFGSCELQEPYPLPCFNIITLITYLFSLLPFTCLACLCASLCLCTLALTPYPTRCVGLSTYVIKSFSISLFCRTNHFLLFLFFSPKYFSLLPPPTCLVSHFSPFTLLFSSSWLPSASLLLCLLRFFVCSLCIRGLPVRAAGWVGLSDGVCFI